MTRLIVLTTLSLLLAGCSLDAILPGPARPDTAPPPLSGNPQRGAEIFRIGVDDEAPACITCHRVSSSGFSLSQGPALVGISERAATRVEGMSAEAYLEDSILNPSSMISSNFRVSMYDEYAAHLSAQDVADLVAYLMTL